VERKLDPAVVFVDARLPNAKEKRSAERTELAKIRVTRSVVEKDATESK
jgi:hypothetical protein